MQVRGQHGADRAIGILARELGIGIVGVGFVVAEIFALKPGRMHILREGRLVLRRQPDDDAFDPRRLDRVDFGIRPVVAPVDQFSVIASSILIGFPPCRETS